MCFKGLPLKNSIKGCTFVFILSIKIVLFLANSADPDEMLPYATFHLGLHCMPKYLITGIQNEKVNYHMMSRLGVI